MKKIGTTRSGSLIVEMSEDEFKRITLLPTNDDPLVIEVIKEARERGNLTPYNFNTLVRLFAENGDFEGTRVIEMLAKISASAPDFRLPDCRRISPQVVKKLRDVLADRKIS